MSAGLEGLLLVDKPVGPTSHDIVRWVREATGQRRIGHTGTLDPMASGLLALALGRATRLVRFLPHSPKGYAGTLELGWTSDTDDATGKEMTRHGGDLPPAEEIARAAATLIGKSRQRPPAFSARKVGGKRLYRLARSGIHVEAPASEIEVFSLSVVPGDRPERYDFACDVTGGTYVRSLVRDLGQRVGCGAVMSALRRSTIGPMRLDQALSLPSRDAVGRDTILAAIVPLEQMPLEPPAVRVKDAEAERRFTQGGIVSGCPESQPDGLVRVLTAAGRLLGVAESRDGHIRPRVVLTPPSG